MTRMWAWAGIAEWSCRMAMAKPTSMPSRPYAMPPTKKIRAVPTMVSLRVDDECALPYCSAKKMRQLDCDWQMAPAAIMISARAKTQLCDTAALIFPSPHQVGRRCPGGADEGLFL